MKALNTDPKEKACSSQSSDIFCPGAGPGVSPGRAVDLKIKNYQQVRYLQQLNEVDIYIE